MKSFGADLTGIPDHIQRIVFNHLLAERDAKLPDYKAEMEATTGIIKAMAETPQLVLTKLSSAIRDLTGADSAGVSLAGRQQGQPILLWQAAAGLFEQYLGSVVPWDESPCGSIIDSNKCVLMLDPGRVYKTAAMVQPAIQELLLVPFRVHGSCVGTVWAISQSSKTFDAEDARVLTNISDIAGLAYQLLIKLDDLQLLNRTVQLVADRQFADQKIAAHH